MFNNHLKNSILNRVGLLPNEKFTDLSIKEIVDGICILCGNLSPEEVQIYSNKFDEIENKNSRTELMGFLLEEVGIEYEIISGKVSNEELSSLFTLLSSRMLSRCKAKRPGFWDGVKIHLFLITFLQLLIFCV